MYSIIGSVLGFLVDFLSCGNFQIYCWFIKPSWAQMLEPILYENFISNHLWHDTYVLKNGSVWNMDEEGLVALASPSGHDHHWVLREEHKAAKLWPENLRQATCFEEWNSSFFRVETVLIRLLKSFLVRGTFLLGALLKHSWNIPFYWF